MSIETYLSKEILQYLLNKIHNNNQKIFKIIEPDILANRFILCYQSDTFFDYKITNTTCHWGNYTHHYAASIKTFFTPIIFIDHYIIFLSKVLYEPVLSNNFQVDKIESDENFKLDPRFFENRTLIPYIFHSNHSFSSIKESIVNIHKNWKSIRQQLLNEIQTII